MAGAEEHQSGASAGRAGRAFSFDPPLYDQVRREGLRQYRQFITALASEEDLSASASDPGRESFSQERPEWGGARRRALEALPPPEEELPLRVLIAIAGNLTWGVLETFHNQPSRPEGDAPASEGLRHWYELYEDDFRRFFPAQQLSELPGAEDWEPPRPETLIPTVLRLAQEYAAGVDRFPDSAVGLAILLRDFAGELARFSEALGFSIDSLLRNLLLAPTRSSPIEPVFGTYQQLLGRIGPGPQTMFCAFALTDGTPVFGNFREEDLLDAAGIEQAAGIDPGSSVHRHARSDAPTAGDRLGVEPLVEGLRALLDDRRTELPLSIGVTAPWGGGKSSLMFQLRRALIEPSAGRHRTWIPIRFDAWKFERSERIWAALARAIYEQSQEQMSRRERIAFKFGLERRRRSLLAFWGGPVGVGVLLVAALLLAFLHRSALPGVVAFVLVLTGAGALLGRLWGLLSDPFKRALNGYTQNPRYEEELGFTTEAEADIRDLTGLLTSEPDHVLVVFVDDLDRCSPAHLVEAIEAINQIFNAAVYEPLAGTQVEPDSGGRPGRCVFVLGMDREMVAAGIEVAYGETIGKLPIGRARNFGLQFLAKIVQLSVAVPKPGPEAIAGLLDGGVAPAAVVETTRQVGSERLVTVGASVPRRESEPLTADHDLPDLRSIPPIPAAVGQEVLFDQDSPEFREAEREAVVHLDRNPRDVKRFDNAFRLQLHVAARTPGCALRFDREDLIAIARWVALRLRWPEFADACDEDVGLLSRIEAAANPDEPASDVGELQAADRRWFQDEELMALLAESRPGCRVGRLQGQTFLRIS